MQIDHNLKLVTELSKFLPDHRTKLKAATLKGIKGSTGFSYVEIFRKYLWYLLRERKFDQAAVDDMVALKVSRRWKPAASIFWSVRCSAIVC